MYSRKTEDIAKVQIPSEQLTKISKAFQEVYGAQLRIKGRSLQVFGFLFPGEFVLSACLKSLDSDTSLPVTFNCSIDLEKQTPPEKTINLLVDYIGIFLEHFCNQEEWADYSQIWEKDEFQKQTVYFQITRDDVELTLAADNLLNQ